jgi:catechol-2,3-dioxygenase
MTDNINQTNICRIIIEVTNLNNAIDFYCNLLNVEGRAVGWNRYYIDCGKVILALLDSSQKEQFKKILQYVYFSIPDLESTFLRAKALDCLSKEEVEGASAGEIALRPWGERSFYVKDPDQNGLCFVDEKTVFTGMK